MEANGAANIKMIIQLYNMSGMPIDELLQKIDGQADILIEYMRACAEVIEINNTTLRNNGLGFIEIPKWHEIKAKMGAE